MTAPDVVARLASWPADRAVIKSIRHAVFVTEQHVPPDLEWDGLDNQCQHCIVTCSSAAPHPEPVATGRLQPDGKIGRMAVLPEYRSGGLGGRVLMLLIKKAKDSGMTRVYLYAQVHAMPFYSRYGFMPYGDEFDEAGIAHIAMELLI